MTLPRPRSIVRWQQLVLLCAAVHCVAWGLFILSLPALSATVYGFAQVPRDLHLWRGSGLFILLLGIGFAVASRDPVRHFAVVLIGLLAKVLGATGICISVWQGQIAPGVLWLLPLNDVVWCWPLSVIVWQALQQERLQLSQTPSTV